MAIQTIGNGKVSSEINKINANFSSLDTKSLPSSGTTGQILKKVSSTDYDVGWENETDVQINGTSIVSSGVANIPVASQSDYGVVKVNTQGTYGIDIGATNQHVGYIRIYPASDGLMKNGNGYYAPITTDRQHKSVFYGLAKASGDSTQSESNNAVGNYTDSAKTSIQKMLNVPDSSCLGIVCNNDTAPTNISEDQYVVWNGKLYKASTDITSGTTLSSGNLDEVTGGGLNDVVGDVQINGTSIVSSGVATVPIADAYTEGVVKVTPTFGLAMRTPSQASPNYIYIVSASSANIKTADTSNECTYKPIVPRYQHESTFYGLAKASGDTTQSQSSNAVGTYTNEAKASIQQMLGVESVCFIENVSGTTPTITGVPNTRYICGEVTSISITPPSNGIIDVIFESGSTPTVLTLPNTVKLPSWFDATSLDTNTTYEINIADGIYGVVMTWDT